MVATRLSSIRTSRAEAAAIGLFGGLFLLAMTRGFLAIRKRDVALHREWMIRTFAIAIAISTVRVFGAVLDIALAPMGIGPQAIFVLAVWAGWIVTVGVAELWIRRARPPVVEAPLLAGGR